MCAKAPENCWNLWESFIFSPFNSNNTLQKKATARFFPHRPPRPILHYWAFWFPIQWNIVISVRKHRQDRPPFIINLIPPSTSGDCHILRDWNSFATSPVSHDALDQWYPRQQAGRIVACVQADKGKSCLLLTLSTVGRSHRVHFSIALLVYNA